MTLVVKVLLDARPQDYMDLSGSDRVKPGYCFYLIHWQAVSGKDRIRWSDDPPPDLVIDVEVSPDCPRSQH